MDVAKSMIGCFSLLEMGLKRYHSHKMVYSNLPLHFSHQKIRKIVSAKVWNSFQKNRCVEFSK